MRKRRILSPWDAMKMAACSSAVASGPPDSFQARHPSNHGEPVDRTIYEYLSSEIQSSAMYVFLSLIHISEPTRLLSISYAVFCLKKKKKKTRPVNSPSLHKTQSII
eukprot:TRINITY_DN2289_c0_g1_i3.p2 TRINITY_DN2289_c0_g1~~TRINITY_DN2289_c0_g1_i3.p2  ORF type:complete len:107 (-),score=17.45 TRINITY_DN2289_c0_g1_i3:66-386(-)